MTGLMKNAESNTTNRNESKQTRL